MKTIRFEFNIGINSGSIDNKTIKDPLRTATDVWMEEAEKIFKTTGIYVSAIAMPGKNLYPKQWGCPTSGQDTIVFRGILNTEFNIKETDWRKQVQVISKIVAGRLGQTTVYLSFYEVDFEYLKTSGETESR